MTGERRTLPGYGIIKPYSQGELSNLCGLYAVINAIRLLVPERAGDRELWAQVYRMAIRHLARARKLKEGIERGLTFEAWKVMQHAVYDELSEHTNMAVRMRPLLRRRSNSMQDVGIAIQHAIDAGRPVLCVLSGTLNHYTVIAGYTPTSWLLQDSSGLRWVARRSTAIGYPQGTSHWIPLAALFIIRLADRGR